MLVGWGRAYGAFVRGLVYMRWSLERAGDAERVRLAADAYSCARYTGLGPGDGGVHHREAAERAELHYRALLEHADAEAVLAAWSLGESPRGVFTLLWAEDDRITLELAKGYLRRALAGAGKGDGTCELSWVDAPQSAA